MAPFVSTRSRLRDSILTFRALFNDTYAVDTDQAIDHMAKRIVERGDFDQVWSIFCPDATKESLRQYMAESQDRILGIKNEIELSASEAEDANLVMRDTAYCTIWRTLFDLIASGVFAGLGLVGLLTRHKFAGVVGLMASVTALFSFFDELDMRSVELNEHFEHVRSLCYDTADRLVEFSMRCSHHNTLMEVLERRFGKDFGRQPRDGDDESEFETYDGTQSSHGGTISI